MTLSQMFNSVICSQKSYNENIMIHQRSGVEYFFFNFFHFDSLAPFSHPFNFSVQSSFLPPSSHVERVVYPPYVIPLSLSHLSILSFLIHFVFLFYLNCYLCILPTRDGRSVFFHILVKPPLVNAKRECIFVLFTCRAHYEL